jgi:hypothetical protein
MFGVGDERREAPLRFLDVHGDGHVPILPTGSSDGPDYPDHLA